MLRWCWTRSNSRALGIIVLVCNLFVSGVMLQGPVHGSARTTQSPTGTGIQENQTKAGLMLVNGLSGPGASVGALDPCGASPPCGDLTYHSGSVMHSPSDFIVFWLPAGYS